MHQVTTLVLLPLRQFRVLDTIAIAVVVDTATAMVAVDILSFPDGHGRSLWISWGLLSTVFDK